MSEEILPTKADITKDVLLLLQELHAHVSTAELSGELQGNEHIGLISVESDGVKVNTDGFWWVHNVPFIVISLLKLLEIPLLNSAEVIKWVKGLQHSSGLFQDEYLGLTARQATYHACTILRFLNAADDTSEWDRVALVNLLQDQQPIESRGISFLPDDEEELFAELEVALCWIGSLSALGEGVRDSGAAIQYLLDKQTADGSFDMGQVEEIPYSIEEATFHAIRGLLLLGAGLPNDQLTIKTIRAWQVNDGAFRANRHPLLLHQTAIAVLILYLLGSEPLHKGKAIAWIGRTWLAEFNQVLRTKDFSTLTLARIYWGLLALTALDSFGSPPAHLKELTLYSLCR